MPPYTGSTVLPGTTREVPGGSLPKAHRGTEWVTRVLEMTSSWWVWWWAHVRVGRRSWEWILVWRLPRTEEPPCRQTGQGPAICSALVFGTEVCCSINRILASQGKVLLPSRTTGVGGRCKSILFLLTYCHKSFSRDFLLGTLSSQLPGKFQKKNCVFCFLRSTYGSMYRVPGVAKCQLWQWLTLSLSLWL